MKINTFKRKAFINLSNNEQVTFFFKKSQLDFVSKNFGAYVTPSFFSRCKKFELYPALIKKKKNKIINLVLVKKDKISSFYKFLKNNKFSLIMWIKRKNF